MELERAGSNRFRVKEISPAMGQRKYPRLTPSEVIAILTALGFNLARQDGSHAQYESPAKGIYPRSIVTVDVACREFDDYLIRSMIAQSHRKREIFYGATKRTARKASVPALRFSSSTDGD